MRKLVLLALSVCMCVAWVSAANARKVSNDTVRREKSTRAKSLGPIDGGAAFARQTAVAADTLVLASYKWDQGPNCVAQGWVTHDLTAQTGDYVHVDNFAGLGGGAYGLLVPLAGAKSLWIGARANPADLNLCGYAVLPGYGNGWHQLFCSQCFTLTGTTTVSYLASWDSEPGYDFTYAQYAPGCSGNWTDAETYDGQSASSSESFVVPAAQHGGSARFRFDFQADGAWSDSDGLWNTDGAFIVDNLVIQDGSGVKSSQTFEAEALNAHATLDGHWQSCNLPGYGNYAGLLPGLVLLQEDPCAKDISCQWTFFTGSSANYSCGGYPAVTAVPFGNANGQYLTNESWSPDIAWTGEGSVAILQYAVYRDLPLDNLVFYVWHVRSIVGGCPQSWFDDNTVYFGDDLDWLQETHSIGQYIDPDATHIQIAIGAWDMCGDWCGSVGSGSCHSHSPLIDNLTVKRVDVAGPQWTVNGWQMFQDNFAGDGTVTGTVRLDMSNDLRQTTDPLITPGDSVAAQVVDPVAGIAIDPLSGSGPAVYAYVAVHPQGQPGKSGSALTDDASRWPVVGSVVDSDGDTWYKVRFDTAYVQNNQTPVQDLYCLDLNDDLFTPGDTVEYFYQAVSIGGATSYFFGGYHALDNFDAAGAIVTTLDIDVAFANPMEVTCLPAAALTHGGDILYVDDGDGRNVQPYFDQAFQMMGILDQVDRYDVRAPSSNVANGPGARVTDVFEQILPYYKKIIWNSEELEDGTIGDGTGTPDKSDDFALLYAFLNNSTLGPGLYISGDGIADDWSNSTGGAAITLKSVYMNFDLATADHKDFGFGVAPKVIGVGGGPFSHPTGPDTLIAYGGCLGINEFDVLDPTGASVSRMRYGGDPDASAVISQTTTNGSNATARVVMEGFSFDLIRDDRPTGIMDRVHHLHDVITFLGNAVDQPTGTQPVGNRDALFQNYPNPFNPSTSIEFTVRDRTRVSVKVFDVAGRLVRTLLDGDREAGAIHRLTWDGRNDAGESVSSGVYFYRLVANDFTQTKKMVLLK